MSEFLVTRYVSTWNSLWCSSRRFEVAEMARQDTAALDACPRTFALCPLPLPTESRRNL